MFEQFFVKSMFLVDINIIKLNITISIIQNLDRMGCCCESKLLGIQPLEQKYENNQIQINEKFDRYDLTQIAPVLKSHKKFEKPFFLSNSSDKQNSFSLLDLKLDLNQAVDHYEEKEGKITYTCLVNPQLKTIRSINNTKREYQSHKPQEKVESFYQNQFQESQNFSKNSSYFFPSQILREVTVNKTSNLEKQLYWAEFATVNHKFMTKWDEIIRKQIAFDQQSCKEIFITSTNLLSKALIMLMHAFAFHYKSHTVRLISYCSSQSQTGLRVFINGLKRCFPIQINSIMKKYNKISFINEFCEHFKKGSQIKDLQYFSQICYHLTGWIPEVIEMKQIITFDMMFQRLNLNLQNNNALVSFVNLVTQQVLILSSIDIQGKQLKIIRVKEQQYNEENLFDIQTIKWPEMITQGYKLNVIWNPLIYEFSHKIQIEVQPFKYLLQYKYQQYPQILISLPPSKNQIEIRFFIEQHSHYYIKNSNSKFLLFQYTGNRKVCLEESYIKQYPINSKLMTDIMLFQPYPVSNKYLLVLVCDYQSQLQTIKQFSLNCYSADQIKVQKLSHKIQIAKKQLTISLDQSKVGYGLVSPFFCQNLSYNIKIPPAHLLRISYQSKDPDVDFQLHLVPSSKIVSNWIDLKSQSLASCEFLSSRHENQGILEIQPETTNFFLIIVLHAIENQSQLQINFECLDVQIQKMSPNKILGGEYILINQTKLLPDQIVFSSQFSWLKTSPGLRNRTKESTQPIFFQEKIFQTFFQNPYFDIELNKGKYFFHLFSKSFLEYFEKTYIPAIKQMNIEERVQFDELMHKPSNISLAIFEIGVNEKKKKKFKIVLDDQFYVPFGFGFQSKIMNFEQGKYRFIFSKIEKSEEVGKFQIHKILPS